MKKAMMMMAIAAAMALSGVAGAQIDGKGGTWQLQGCYIVKEGTRCDFRFTASEDGFKRDFRPGAFQGVTSDGKAYTPVVSAAGGEWSSGWTDDVVFYKGVPVAVSALFKGLNTSQFAVLAVEEQPIRSVPVRNSTASAPAPIARPPAAPAPAQINIAGTWNATLTNCRQASAGVVVCTATLRK